MITVESIRAALACADKLAILAMWFDVHDKDHDTAGLILSETDGHDEVQRDLRRWAADMQAILASLPESGVIVSAEQAAFGEAWERAEKACPKGWHLNQVCAPLRSAPSQWAVIAAPDDWHGPDSMFAHGPTVTAALTALAEKLEGMK